MQEVPATIVTSLRIRNAFAFGFFAFLGAFVASLIAGAIMFVFWGAVLGALVAGILHH
jgi:hypothetical protein